MSAVHHYKLKCDRAGCTAEINLGLPRADQTRAEASKLGWRHEYKARENRSGPGHSYDFCPDHSQEQASAA